MDELRPVSGDLKFIIVEGNVSRSSREDPFFFFHTLYESSRGGTNIPLDVDLVAMDLGSRFVAVNPQWSLRMWSLQ